MRFRKTRTIPDRELLEMILRGEITAKKIKSKNPIVVVRGKELVPQLVKGHRNPRWRVKIYRPRIGQERCLRQRSIVRGKIV